MKLWYEFPELACRRVLYGYVVDGLTVDEIALKVGCSRKAVQSALKNHGIRRPIVVKISERVRE